VGDANRDSLELQWRWHPVVGGCAGSAAAIPAIRRQSLRIINDRGATGEELLPTIRANGFA